MQFTTQQIKLKWEALKPQLKRPRVYLPLILVVLLGYRMIFGGKDATPSFVEAKTMDITQEVQVTGSVKPTQKVDLAFERSARVYKNFVKVGDKVKEGQILAMLEQGAQSGDYNGALARVQSAQATVEQYEASVVAAQAKLDELLGGERPEELALLDADIKKAESTKDAYISDYKKALQDAYNNTQTAIQVTIAPMFQGTQRNGYVLSYATCEEQAKTDAQWQRGNLETMLLDWGKQQDGLVREVTVEGMKPYYVTATANIESAKKFIDVLNKTVNSCNQGSSTNTTYQSYVTTVRSAVNLAQSTLNSAKVAAENQTVQVKKLQDDRDLSAQSAREESVRAQSAQVRAALAQLNAQKASLLQARAQLQSSGAVLAQGAIRAPISGIVTKNDLKEGEVASAFSPVITVQDEQFEMEAFVPETDIAKVGTNLTARVTLDAYGSDQVFEAKVVYIDPAETKIEGISTYKVKLQFVKSDERIRSGMTASLYIETARRSQVIAIPERAVVLQNGTRIVRLLNNDNTITEVGVELGLRGSAGFVEVIKGVQAGDKLVTGEVK